MKDLYHQPYVLHRFLAPLYVAPRIVPACPVCALRSRVEGWEFPKFGGTLFWGPYNKDPTI